MLVLFARYETGRDLVNSLFILILLEIDAVLGGLYCSKFWHGDLISAIIELFKV